MEIGGAVLGVAQPILMRQYLDTQYGSVIPQLGVYGTPSFLAGAIGGGVATTAALASLIWNKGIQDKSIAKALLSYGIPALTGSILIAFFTQTVTTPQALPQAKMIPQQGKAAVPQQATVVPLSPAMKNFQALTPSQRVAQSVY